MCLGKVDGCIAVYRTNYPCMIPTILAPPPTIQSTSSRATIVHTLANRGRLLGTVYCPPAAGRAPHKRSLPGTVRGGPHRRPERNQTGRRPRPGAETQLTGKQTARGFLYRRQATEREAKQICDLSVSC